MGQKQHTDWREARRFRALELSEQGWSGVAIAEALGVTEGAVSQWLGRAREGGGKEALRARKASGRPPRLSRAEKEQLPALLKQGAEHFGFRGGGVDPCARGRGDPSPLWRAVPRQPRGTAAQGAGLDTPKADSARDGAQRGGDRALGRGRMAAHQKKAADEQRTLIFADEAGFRLLPAVVKSYAPAGETPVLRTPLRREHLSVIAGITPEGKLYQSVREGAFRGPDIVRFLQHLLRRIEGKLLLVWDGLPAHRSQVVKAFLGTEAGKRLHLERLPGYAPELNPEEGIWKHLKYVEMKNLCCADRETLREELRRATERLRHKTHVIQACFRQVGLV